MNHRVGIDKGDVEFHRGLTRKTVSGIRFESICHHVSRNNIRKNDTGLTGTMHYDLFRRITRLQAVLLHSKNSKYELHILRYITIVDTL